MVIEKGAVVEPAVEEEELDPSVDPRKPVEQTVEPEEDLTVIDDVTPEDENPEPEVIPETEPEQSVNETDDAYLKRIEAGQGKNVVKEFQGKFAKLNKEIEALKANKPPAPVQTEPVTPDYTRVKPYVEKFKATLANIDKELDLEGLHVKIGEQLFDPLMSIVFNAIHTETDFKINKDYGDEIGTIRKSSAEKKLDTVYETLKSDESLKFEATKYEKEVKKFIKDNYDSKLWDKADLVDMAFHKVMTDIKRQSPGKPAVTKPVPKLNESRSGGAGKGNQNTGGVLRSELEAEADRIGVDINDSDTRAKVIRIIKLKHKHGG